MFPFLRFIALFCCALWSVDALAQLAPVENLADETLSTVDAIGLVVTTIAIIVAGFLILFTTASLRLIVGILIGGLLIGNADEVAQFVTGLSGA